MKSSKYFKNWMIIFAHSLLGLSIIMFIISISLSFAFSKVDEETHKMILPNSAFMTMGIAISGWIISSFLVIVFTIIYFKMKEKLIEIEEYNNQKRPNYYARVGESKLEEENNETSGE